MQISFDKRTNNRTMERWPWQGMGQKYNPHPKIETKAGLGQWFRVITRYLLDSEIGLFDFLFLGALQNPTTDVQWRLHIRQPPI